MTTLQIQTARVFAPLLQTARYKGAKGGRASGKSHNYADNVVDLAVTHPGLRVVCIREVQKSLKFSAKLLLEDKIKKHSVQHIFHVTNTEIKTPGDGIVIFQGMQDHTAESIKSLEGFDIAWVEEAQSLSQRSLDLLRPTIRSTERTVLQKPELWFSWNPKLKTDPVDVFFASCPPDSVLVTANYSDNPWFPTELYAEMEWDRLRDPDKYAHVWLGSYLIRSEARVFKNWRVEEFDTPYDAEFYLGADWGFSVDPTVLVRCFIVGRTLYIDREVYRVGCEVDHTPDLFDQLDPEKPAMARQWVITADSARPETISYMRRNGYPRIVEARKGAGSVEEGVEFLKTYDIVVHPSCRHTIDELTHYSYKTDRITDTVLPILLDKKNHIIDAIRYAIEAVRHKIQGPTDSKASLMSRIYDGGVSSNVMQSAAEFAEDETLEVEYYDGGLT